MKLRKLASLAMTAVLSLTLLAGCGSDDKDESKSDGSKAASISEAYERAAAMEKYTLSGSFTMSMSGDYLDNVDEEIMDVIGGGDGITLAGTWDGKIDTKNNAADVSLGISLGGKSSVEILDYVLADGDAYIGLRTMADGLEKLLSDILSDIPDDDGSSIAEIIGGELPDGNYLKVSEETLKEIVGMVEDVYGDIIEESGMPITIDSYEDMVSEFMNSDEYKEVEKTVKYFAELLIKGMKNGSDNCFTNDGDTYKMTINKNNINDILSGVLEQVEKNSDEIAKKINSIAGDEVISSSELEQMAALMSVYDIAKLMGEYDFSFSLSASYVDDTFKSGIAFAFSDSTNRIAVSVENTAKKDKDLVISAPSDVISDEDAEPIIDEFMNGLRYGLDSTYGDIPFDDFDEDWQDNDFDFDDFDFDDFDFDYEDDDLNDDNLDDNDLDNNEKDTEKVESTINSSDKQYASIKEYVESDEFQAEIESQMKSYEGMGMDMKITAEGNKLVYTYKYIDEQLIDDDFTLEDAKEYFDSAIETQKSTFVSVCKQLPLYIDVENPVVVLRYYDLDDTLIWEREFTAED